jgi:hypothetical protein
MARRGWRNPLPLAAVGLALMVGGWKASTYVPGTAPERAAAEREPPGGIGRHAEGAQRLPPYRLAGRLALLAGLALFVTAGVLMYRQPPAEEERAEGAEEKTGPGREPSEESHLPE